MNRELITAQEILIQGTRIHSFSSGKIVGVWYLFPFFSFSFYDFFFFKFDWFVVEKINMRKEGKHLLSVFYFKNAEVTDWNPKKTWEIKENAISSKKTWRWGPLTNVNNHISLRGSKHPRRIAPDEIFLAICKLCKSTRSTFPNNSGVVCVARAVAIPPLSPLNGTQWSYLTGPLGCNRLLLHS